MVSLVISMNVLPSEPVIQSASSALTLRYQRKS